MRIVVQKYGGSSLSTPEKIKRIAEKVVAQRHLGHQVAVVVSAMGNTTDNLLELARATSARPPGRELDVLLTAGEQISMALLSMAIADLGQDSISLSGPQAGIITCQAHNRARIREVRPRRVMDELALGKIVVVAGFQGRSPSGDVTTLGRGGSDTSAVALAAALGAERCDIYSDVDGVYTSDPRVVPEARLIDRIGYDEMREMARCGARVLNADAVEFARRARLEIRALSTFEDGPGTRITDTPGGLGGVVGVAGRDDLFTLELKDSRHTPRLERLLGEVDVFRAQGHEMLVSAENIPDIAALRRRLGEEFGSGLAFSNGLGSVSLISAVPGWGAETAARALRLLETTGLAPLGSFVDPLSVTCLVKSDAVSAAKKVLHTEFIPLEVTV